MQTITLQCDDTIAKHLYSLLSAVNGVKISNASSIQKKSSKKSFLEFSGIWKNRDISLNDIRTKAWQR